MSRQNWRPSWWPDNNLQWSLLPVGCLLLPLWLFTEASYWLATKMVRPICWVKGHKWRGCRDAEAKLGLGASICLRCGKRVSWYQRIIDRQ